MTLHLHQEPAPGAHRVCFRGDVLCFELTLSETFRGKAFLRTNLGHGNITRNEILRKVRYEDPPLARDWFDIPMKRVNEQTFQVAIPLCEVGHFEAKALFIPAGEDTPLWPPGPNTVINIEPAHTCCANIVYNAFVRQFGPNRGGGFFSKDANGLTHALDQKKYTVIPPSGTFRDLIEHLDFIVYELGCRMIQLLPVHPTPTTYARMGRFGSPYAALSFTAVDPALARFDPKATPLDQFIELVDAVHARGAELLLDIAINHTGWAASIHGAHPEWLVRDPEGQIQVPGAWGVRWEDLTHLDYSRKDLWQYMAEVFLLWCRRGVDGFRCDAGYMIPLPAWQYMIATVREQFPDTIFLLEGLGGSVSVTRDLLNKGNFNWAYSELFQNHDRSQIEHYLPGALEASRCDGIMVHYAETHDNNRLAARSRTWARMRTALAALAAPQGAFGFANGVEWFATEKINVHESTSLNWGSPQNQVAEIQRLTLLLQNHPAFHDQTDLHLIQEGQGNVAVLLRHHRPSDQKLVVVVNLSDQAPARALWEPAWPRERVLDLLAGKTVQLKQQEGLHGLDLEPGQVLCLSADPGDARLLKEPGPRAMGLPRRLIQQQQRAMLMEVFRHFRGVVPLEELDLETAAENLLKNPLEGCRSLNPCGSGSCVAHWNWPRDLNRTVMIPPHHLLLVQADHPFRARVVEKERVLAVERSLKSEEGRHFCLFPFKAGASSSPTQRQIQITVYHPEGTRHSEGRLLFLPEAQQVRLQLSCLRTDLLERPRMFLHTNGKGAMLHVPVAWGELWSRYDALLAANWNPHFPEDRWMLFTRCRAWIVYQGFSQEICRDCLDAFWVEKNGWGMWRFVVPTGQGNHVILHVGAGLEQGENQVTLGFHRSAVQGEDGRLGNNRSVKLILRPDLENRSFHESTKAYLGPEQAFPKAVEARPAGFLFQPDTHHGLDMDLSEGTFTLEPEWLYMVHRPYEAERGQDPNSDLFSPGYFSATLLGGQSTVLTARGIHPKGPQGDRSPSSVSPPLPKGQPQRKTDSGLGPEGRGCMEGDAFPSQSQDPVSWLRRSLDQYVVDRTGLKSVIAGYPWFLDWGRDALIAVRGILAGGDVETARAVIQQFGRFEQQGTLPNMIAGDNAQNRDTSDAPLWLCVVCEELAHAEKGLHVLQEPCGSRTLKEVLLSIGNAFCQGTPNGIRMDPKTGLIFSPSHFTWMDTNHPAGTPRQGYPVEIQALWYRTLCFLGRIDFGPNKERWNALAQQVQSNVRDLFFLEDLGFFSDCLHAGTGESATKARPDDALRPNQLFLLTLDVIQDSELGEQVLSACQELLIPGAIRSLADRPVRFPLRILHHGQVLGDPVRPFRGTYEGDEDLQRKPAYHNGTAWTWPFPSFCEAWVCVYGKAGVDTALSYLSSMFELMETGCLGHVPEVLDGNAPHRHRGCDAQAWGVSELLRVWLKLQEMG